MEDRLNQRELLPLAKQDVASKEDSLSFNEQTFMVTLTHTVTFIRFALHVIIGVIIGVIYYNVGDEASLAMRNAWCIFLTISFGSLSALVPSILTR